MRRLHEPIAALLIIAAGAWAQEGSVAPAPYHQRPDKDGVYFVGPDVSAPSLTFTTDAILTEQQQKADVRGFSVWSMVIRADGTAAEIHLAQPLGVEFDTAAIKAINQCKFSPGTTRGSPVPVHIGVAVPFHSGKPTTPFISFLEKDLDPAHDKWKGFPGPNPHPVLIHKAEAQFSSTAMRAKYQGIVLVSAVVGVDGVPTDVREIRLLGMGLDAKAIEAVKLYRYLPAMKGEEPVPERITIEVNFQLY